eukprot:5292652-Ditylum_brightwellii.AAC.1
MRHSPIHRRMNFESSERRSPSHPSHGGQVNVTKAEVEEEGEGTPKEKSDNYKQGRTIAASVFKNMKAISKKKGEVGEVYLPKALIMSLFEGKDVKKAIRASVSSVEVAVKVLPPKDAVSQALSTPYVAPKKSVNLAAAIMRSLN